MSTALATETKAQQRTGELERISGPALEPNNAQLAVPTRSAPDLPMGGQGITIRTLDDAWTFANIVFNSRLAPKTLDSPAKVLIALQLGMEVGLPPMAAIQNVAVINDRPSLWGDVMLGLCRASGKFDESAYDETFEYDKEGADRIAIKAICTVRRLPDGKPITKEFSWADAIKAGLDSKDTYKKYRGPMLMSRARVFSLRAGFSDVLKGVLSAEEARDLPPPERNITPAPATAKPTTIEELTERMNGEASPLSQNAVETAALPETSLPETPAPETAPTDQLFPAGDANDPLAAVKHQLRLCITVPDVTRYQNTITGPASRLMDLEKGPIDEVCEARKKEIRAARK